MISKLSRAFRLVTTLAAVGLWSACAVQAAEHAKITLDVTARGETKTAHMDQTPPDVGKSPRPVLKAKAGDSIKIQYIFTNIYPHKTLENVVIHFYVARAEKVGQKTVPDLTREANVVLETAFDMDIKPGGKAGGRMSIKVDEPGVYMVRVESIKTQSDHEHFAAIDLVVEEAKP